jgi:hypothetical protein
VFNKAFCQPGSKHYVTILKDMYKFYKTHASQDTLSGFLDLMAKFFIPRDSYEEMGHDRRKDSIVKNILCRTLTRFTMHINEKEIDHVVNEKTRSNKDLIVNLKNKYIEMIIIERNEFSSILLAKNSGINIKNKDEIPSISKEISDKMQETIRKLIVEKEELKKERNSIVQYCQELVKKVEQQGQLISELEKNQYRPRFPRYYNQNSELPRASELTRVQDPAVDMLANNFSNQAPLNQQMYSNQLLVPNQAFVPNQIQNQLLVPNQTPISQAPMQIPEYDSSDLLKDVDELTADD